MNLYDVRLVDDWPACGMNWPPDLADVYLFLRVSFLVSPYSLPLTLPLDSTDSQRPDVVTALHATKKDTAWVECDGKVGHELRNANSPAAVTLLPEILEAGVPIMMFAGAEDLICNAAGIKRICDDLKWDGLLGMGVSSA